MAILSLEHQALLTQYNKNIRKKNLAHLQEIKGLLNTIFGEEHNQISEKTIYEDGDTNISISTYMQTLISRVENVHYEVTIHFPEFEISNTKKQVHTIRDLYVRFQMKGNLRLKMDIEGQSNHFLQGMRTTFTPHEWISEYAHSHLYQRRITFGKFCTGTGPINIQALKLSNGYKSVDCKMFLHLINGFVRHESLEGRPHTYIENIGKDVVVPTSLNVNHKKLFTQFLGNIKLNRKLLDYTINDYQITVKSTVAFEEHLCKAIILVKDMPAFQEAVNRTSIDFLIPYKLADGRYTTAQTENRISTNDRTLIEFKSQPKKLKIVYESESNDGRKCAHPYITKSLCEQFGQYLTEIALAKQNARW